ncbi:MAG TPA: ribonuclease H [Ktedonobacteraceae bacterium]|nr:ribonuclease H [Ktedonobacteraceae bacterium]
MSLGDESLEWQSVLEELQKIPVETAYEVLGDQGTVAYTDGACIKNPGGPAGWSVILASAEYLADENIREDAPRIESYGHIPASYTTTNNRAEIAAVIGAICIAPRDKPLTIYSDSEYTIKVAEGTYQVKANPDLWDLYRILAKKRTTPPTFIWVRGHAGHRQNERADELAGLGAWNRDEEAFRKWRESMMPTARNGLASGEMVLLRQQVQKLKTYVDSVALDSARVSTNERAFINDMSKRLRKNNFFPTEKQSNWVKVLVKKYQL